MQTTGGDVPRLSTFSLNHYVRTGTPSDFAAPITTFAAFSIVPFPQFGATGTQRERLIAYV